MPIEPVLRGFLFGQTLKIKERARGQEADACIIGLYDTDKFFRSNTGFLEERKRYTTAKIMARVDRYRYGYLIFLSNENVVTSFDAIEARPFLLQRLDEFAGSSYREVRHNGGK